MKQVTVTCPYCDYEYLLGEIFLPKHLVGQPDHIEHDCYGKVIYSEGIQQDNEEKYNCDRCGKTFLIKAKITTQSQKI